MEEGEGQATFQKKGPQAAPLNVRNRLVKQRPSEQLGKAEGDAREGRARRNPCGGGTRLFDPEVEVEGASTRCASALTPLKAQWVSSNKRFAYGPNAVMVPNGKQPGTSLEKLA